MEKKKLKNIKMMSVHFLSTGLSFVGQMVKASIFRFGHRILKFGIKLKVMIRLRKITWLKFAEIKSIVTERSI